MVKNKELKKDYIPNNSSMAPSFKEMNKLGKQMENHRTNKKVKEKTDKTPDPIQYSTNKD